MDKQRIIAILTGLALVVGFLGATSTTRLSAQESGTATATVAPTATPLPTPTAYPLQKLNFSLLATADIQLATDGPSNVRAATLYIAPGTSSLPFINEGPTVLAVMGGQIVLISDQAIVSVTDIAFVAGLVPVGASPGPVDQLVVNTGEQIYLPAGSTTTIRNDSAAPASVLIVAVIPFQSVTPTP